VRLLQQAGYHCTVVDNLSTGHRASVGDTPLHEGDIRDRGFLNSIFSQNNIELVMHFASCALVEESMRDPLLYYDNNIAATMCLLEEMKTAGCSKLVFSSTCAVYGEPKKNPINDDDCPTIPINPYGETKLAIERMLHWCEQAYDIKYFSLRYFNAAGAMPDGSIGEDHSPESHLIPNVIRAALNNESVLIFGKDYPTQDGTCIRDYIHVVDLADAHIKAMEYLLNGGKSEIMNLGTGIGHSNLQIVNEVKRISNIDFPIHFNERRTGDPPMLVAMPVKAKKLLAWESRYSTISTLVEDAWRWHKSHPSGFIS
jgi:UDP-glucose 4-epimerase